MSLGDIIYRLPNETKTLIRHIEQTEKKRIKCKYALAFNITCKNEDILPKYTNIKVSPAARAKRFTKDYRRQLVIHEIEAKENELTQLNEKLVALKAQLSNVSSTDVSDNKFLAVWTMLSRKVIMVLELKRLRSCPNYTVAH